MAAVNSERISGVDTYVLYAKQTGYGTQVTPTTIFGGLVTRANFDDDRQYNERPGFAGTQAWDGRATAQHLAGTMSSTGTVDFDAQRWDWLELLLLANRTGEGTTGTPYIYTTGSTSTPISISEEIDNVATDSSRVRTMVLNSARIRCGVGEPVSVSTSFIGGGVVVSGTVNAKQAQLVDEVYNFSGGTIKIGDDDFINVIDSVDLNIDNNYTLLYGFSEEAVNARPGKLSISMDVSAKYLTDAQMTKFTGKTLVDVILKFTKGTNKYVEFTLKDVVLNRVGTDHSLNEFVIEETGMIAKRIEVKEVI